MGFRNIIMEELENENNFKIQIELGNGSTEASVITSLIDEGKTSLFSVFVTGVKIAELQMDSNTPQWISKYGSLDHETIQSIGSKIEDYFD
jgi:hypothetical protein